MRKRIVLLVAATTSVVLLAFALPLIALVRDQAKSAAIENGRTVAQALVPVVSNGDSAQISLVLTSLNEPEGISTTVILANGSAISTSTISDPDISAIAANAARDGATTVATPSGGQVILIPVFISSGVRIIAVNISHDALTEGLLRASVVIGGLALALFLASLFIADRIAASITRPLTELAKTADALAEGNLDARATPDGPPEVHDVGTAINALAKRIGELLQAERQSIADLSHRLRTPLTALRLDAEALSDAPERGRIENDIDLLERGLDDVIRAANHPLNSDLIQLCDAGEITQLRVQFWSALAEDQDRPVTTDISDDPMPLPISADDLAACLDAALGNIFAHTDEGVGFTVTAQPWIDNMVHIVIDDEGTGLNQTSLTERGVSGSGSTGLGLDIMRRTTESTGGGLRIGKSPTGGTRLEMTFGHN